MNTEPAENPFAQFTEKDKQRFWASVDKTDPSGCWLWIGGAKSTGYGQVMLSGRRYSVHRASWLMHNGAIPNKLFVCHHCDIRLCVNPKCLFLGTAKDNMADRDHKGRQARGETHGHLTRPGMNVKLARAEVLEIRRLYALGRISQYALAAQFNVTQSNISLIVRNEGWRFVV